MADKLSRHEEERWVTDRGGWGDRLEEPGREDRRGEKRKSIGGNRKIKREIRKKSICLFMYKLKDVNRKGVQKV